MQFFQSKSSYLQNRIKNGLLTFKRVSSIKTEGQRAIKLSIIAKHISNRAPKCRATYRHQSHQIDFVKKALIKKQYDETILMASDDDMNFQLHYTNPANALQLHMESYNRE